MKHFPVIVCKNTHQVGQDVEDFVGEGFFWSEVERKEKFDSCHGQVVNDNQDQEGNVVGLLESIY
jgi:hypothetical protein